MLKNPSQTTPLFPGFHIETLSRKRRSQQQIHTENRDRLRQGAFHQLGRMLTGFLPDSLLESNESGANSRKRIFTKANIFFAFFGQILNEDKSCQGAVHRIREQAQSQGFGHLPSANTASYATARGRLKDRELSQMFYDGAGAVELEAPRRFGRPLIAVDGTTFTMPDTPSNQKEWPQSSEQAEGIGFPLMKLVGAFSVDTGALLDRQIGNKHDHELSLLREMKGSFKKDDILAGDRAFGSYCDLAEFKEEGVDMIVRKHQARKEIPATEAVRVVTDQDRWVTWEKPQKQPEHLSDEAWERIPKTMRVREITYRVEQAGFRSRKVVVNTLLDEEEYNAGEIAETYRARWMAEVSFRDLKQTINSHELRCKSPRMIRKELWMNLIVYNAMCFLQMKAVHATGTDRSLLSFKGCLQVVRAWEHRFRDWKASARKLCSELYEHMVSKLLVIRPNRVEPRVNKRRPKIIRLMTKPRRILREEILATLPRLHSLQTPLKLVPFMGDPFPRAAKGCWFVTFPYSFFTVQFCHAI